MKIFLTFLLLIFPLVKPLKNNGPNPRSFWILVGGGAWAPETSTPPHWTNPRAACMDVPDLVSLQYKIAYEKQDTKITASLVFTQDT